MQNVKINMLDLQSAVSGLLEDEVKTITRNADKITKEVAKETCEVVKKAADFVDQTGKYRRSIKTSEEESRVGSKVYSISAKNGQHRLSHLLEDEHKTVKKSGKYGKAAKTAAFPHFTVGAEYADRAIDQKVKELVNEN